MSALPFLSHWRFAMPEIILAGGVLLLLVYGVFRGDRDLPKVTWASLVVCALALLFAWFLPSQRVLAFGSLFVTDGFARFAKVIILGSAMVSALLAVPFLQRHRIGRFEYPLLILFATIGMCVMVSAHDLITLYIGLELQSLSLYILASLHRDDVRSTEAGLKYFVLGALSSGLLLYGSSLVYGYSGTTDFAGLSSVLIPSESGFINVGILFGLVFVLAGLVFKISAVPFHMWTPDVYEGAPTPVTAFFSAAPKIAAMCLLLRVLFDVFGHITHVWQQIIIFISAASMLVGALAALAQTNIKRLLAFSSIGHVGYALIGVACANEAGVQAVLIYLAIYAATTLTAFLAVLAMRNQDSAQIEDITALQGLAQYDVKLGLILTILMFSLAGIPPLVGFFAKFYIFKAAMATGTSAITALAIWGVLSSVIAAAYYIRIIKLIWFDPAQEQRLLPPSKDRANTIMLALGSASISPLGLCFLAPLSGAATLAAHSLFWG